MDATTPKFAPIAGWQQISGMSRRTTYEEIGRGNLRAVKRGASTLIDVEHGLGWLRSLPPAKIRAPRERSKRAA
jgi:hypothetical protein